MQTEAQDANNSPAMEAGTYEIIQQRLVAQAKDLEARLQTLNESRKAVFGAVEMQLLATDRINTENNCISQDLVALGNLFILGYNVHIGLRAEMRLKDVFSVYRFDESDYSLHEEELSLLEDTKFQEDFHSLYKYYKDTVFSKFAVIGPFLYMVFQVGKGVRDVKTFKWQIDGASMKYLGNRFDHEFKYPNQHEFDWKRTHRDMHRRGVHPHISIQDRLFIETIGGDLTVKIEDNTDTGQGIYAEPVDNPDQTLDDAECYYADLGNLIVLKIKPYQEDAFRYLIFNEKLQEVARVDSLEHACVRLPDEQGLIFSNGYYLQNGTVKLFDNIIQGLVFEKRISAPNGEDFLYCFYHQVQGTYVLLPYNLIEQRVETPIICSGFSLFPNGELCYFKREEQPGRHHVIQVWQTPYTKIATVDSSKQETYLFKVGNKDIVRGMAECRSLLSLLNKGESYRNLYIEVVNEVSGILDAYYWIGHSETANLAEPLAQIKETATTAIDEYAKVRKLQQNARESLDEVQAEVEKLLGTIRRRKAKQVSEFVDYLAQLRTVRGQLIGLKSMRYAKLEEIEALEQQVIQRNDQLSEDCVKFLLSPDALKPYEAQSGALKVELGEIKKVKSADDLGKKIDQLAQDLELLIEVVSNLKIEDATQTTAIINRISIIFTQINQLRAQLKTRRKSFLSQEAEASFHAQLALLDQSLANYLDLSDTPDKCDQYLTKLSVQLEELESHFSEFEHFLDKILEQREQIFSAFESRKLQLVEARNRRTQSLMRSAERILKGINNRVKSFKEEEEIHAFFASDLLIAKVRDLVDQLRELEDSVKADDLQGRLKNAKEDAIRQLKDRKELFLDGENVIKFGQHRFSVNVQALDLSMIQREGEMFYHLSGTNFYEEVEDAALLETREVWDQHLVSENSEVYRAEYLAYQLWKGEAVIEDKSQAIQDYLRNHFDQGYMKGVHDQDALKIWELLERVDRDSGLLRFDPQARALGSLFWHYGLDEAGKKQWQRKLQTLDQLSKIFPDSHEDRVYQEALAEAIARFTEEQALPLSIYAETAAAFLLALESAQNDFVISRPAAQLYEQFMATLRRQKSLTGFQESLAQYQDSLKEAWPLLRTWLTAFVNSETGEGLAQHYWPEVAFLLLSGQFDTKWVKEVHFSHQLEGMAGQHLRMREGVYDFEYFSFLDRLQHFESHTQKLFEQFSVRKKELLESFREELRLDSFRPRVLSSFVRNQLIDKFYLPLIGDNLAKQMGTVGEDTRTDRMGMLLLISPPGYGKTTLMEYVANRLGLIFMKINGPAIGHEVSSLDPSEAPNAAAREEVQKLNLAFEMGDNVMIYLDDIQHCNPELLQKFISLCDAQRKIEGVYKGQSRTYDLRGKKVAVVMAGNPYTESGEKFRIPDMLSNRADTYNLGDIVAGGDDAFKLSYLENSLTSNRVLQRLSTAPKADLYQIIQMAEKGQTAGTDFQSHITPEALREYISVFEKLIRIRDVVLAVNQQYIASAAQADEFRTEPPFLLQGSYRNMNKLAEKISPVMNEQELNQLILSHYQSESQTLTSSAEANLLRFKQLNGYAEAADQARWEEIVEIFQREKLMAADRLGQLVQQMGNFSAALDEIRKVLEKGVGKE